MLSQLSSMLGTTPSQIPISGKPPEDCGTS